MIAALTAAGGEVVGIDREPLPGVLRADLLAHDPRADDALRTADAVVHLAGCPGVRDDRPDAEGHRHRDNVLATARVLDLVPATTPLLVTSSSSVYGGTRSGRPCREDDGLRPTGGYAESKVAVERLCAGRARSGGRVTVVRPFTVAGEGQRADMALARWLAAAERGEPLRVFGSLTRTRDVTDARDFATAVRLLVDRPVTATVNIGTGTPHPLADLVSAVASAVGRPVAVEVVPAAAEEVADTRADVTRLERLTGFRPVTDLGALVARQHAAAVHRSVPAGAAPTGTMPAEAPPADAMPAAVALAGLTV